MHTNPIDGFTVDTADIHYIGQGLNRPECVITQQNGDVYCSDGRGGIMALQQNGRQLLIPAPPREGSVPNGFTIDGNGDFLIADFNENCFFRMTHTGKRDMIINTVDDMPMGKANFVYRDHNDHIWLTVSCLESDMAVALDDPAKTGYIALLQDQQFRIVADELDVANECRIDNSGDYVYVAETRGRCISRFRLQTDGSLAHREIFGPPDLGGMPDGIAFDAYGNLWGTLACRECVFALTPEGKQHIILDAGKPDKIAALEAAQASGRHDWEAMLACASDIAPIMTSIAFGGSDLKTVYIGNLLGERLATFRSPIAGRQMRHW